MEPAGGSVAWFHGDGDPMNPTHPWPAFAMLILVGCSHATLTKEECRTVDWRTVGYEDGAAGRPADQIGLHRQACAEHGVKPDLDAYLSGRTAGLREFCQPYNGYRAGASGVEYYDSCPPELAPAFLAAYESGHELYVRERRVADADAGIAARRNEVLRLEDAIVRRGFRVADGTATPEQRSQAVLDTKQIAERIVRLRSEIAALEEDRERYARELETYRSTVASTK
jgi:hypothetical protein